jgi:hypothetical protein
MLSLNSGLDVFSGLRYKRMVSMPDCYMAVPGSIPAHRNEGPVAIEGDTLCAGS